MSLLQKHGVSKLKKAIKAVENKRKGITGNPEEVRERLRPIMDAVDHPVPDRELPDE